MQQLMRHTAALLMSDEGARRATIDRRAYWRLLYRDGRILNEWEGWDWLDVPRKGQQAVRLCCPNGQVATLGNDSDASGRLFQFKIGVLTLPVGEKDPSEERERFIVEQDRFQAAWERPLSQPRRKRRQPLPARRTVSHVIGMLQGSDGRCTCLAWEVDPELPTGGRLTAAWEDNTYLFRYHALGPLRPDVLGIRAT